MLGLRRFHDIQIDLWQGVPDTFVTDRLVRLDGRLALQAFEEFWSKAAPSHHRHLSFACAVDVATAPELAPQVFQVLRDTLSSSAVTYRQGGLERITLILPSLDVYGVFQRSFFAAFPEV